MSPDKQRRTFISYSRINKDFALNLARELRASGFDIWLDQLDIPAGARWDDEVEQALEDCEIFMVILTPASSKSDNVKDEIGYAIDTGKRILPILLENAKVPLRLRRFQYVDFTMKDYSEGVEAAKKLLRRLIEEPTLPRDQAHPTDDSRKVRTAVDRVSKQKIEEEKLFQEQRENENTHIPAQAQPIQSPPAAVPQKAEPVVEPPQKKSMLPLIIGVAGVGALAFIAVIVIVIANLFNKEPPVTASINGNPTAESIVEQVLPTKEPTATATPIVEDTPTEAPVTDIPPVVPVTSNVNVFGDDFSDKSGDWPNDDYGFYENNFYYLRTFDDQHYTTSSPDIDFFAFGSDVDLHVDFTYSPDVFVGLYCRMQENGEFYQFQVEGKDFYSIWYNDGNDWNELTSGRLNIGNDDPYSMSGECIGEELTLYVNYEQIATVTDSRITDPGEFGLYSETSIASGATSQFDNFVAFSPFEYPQCSSVGDQELDVDIQNQTGTDLVFLWVDYDCITQYGGLLPADDSTTLYTYVSHPFLFIDAKTGEIVYEYVAQDGDSSISIP